MSTNPRPTSEAAGGAANLTKPIFEAMQQGAGIYFAMPQKLMQANLEATTSAFGFINRCMAAQADAWSKMSSANDLAKASDVQRAFLEAVSKDSAEEVSKLAEIAKKNFAVMSSLATAGVNKGLSPGNSS
jgi:uncharacterized glyoxalase superfamily protein PhnB